jgi:DNA-binding XRE family transcriptional regulator
MVKINWLWDTMLDEKEVRKILKNADHPKFDIYAEKLLSRVSDPKIVFDIINEVSFCRRWQVIKRRIQKDQWLRDRVVFWQTIYERAYERLREQGIRIRKHQGEKVSSERMKVAYEIKNIRMKSGYTQKEMAKKLGVIQQYISKIENGRENVSIDTLKRIADVFNKRLIVELR